MRRQGAFYGVGRAPSRLFTRDEWVRKRLSLLIDTLEDYFDKARDLIHEVYDLVDERSEEEDEREIIDVDAIESEEEDDKDSVSAEF